MERFPILASHRCLGNSGSATVPSHISLNDLGYDYLYEEYPNHINVRKCMCELRCKQ